MRDKQDKQTNRGTKRDLSGRIKSGITALFTLALVLGGALPLFSITAEEIIQKMEANQVHDTSYSEGEIHIADRFGTKTSTFRSWSEGDERMLLEFTSRAERGQKILRTEDEIYLFFPDADELIRLQGAALRDSVLGSDISYEDMTGDKGILDSYKVKLLGEEAIDGKACYKVELEAISRDVPYPKEIMWVDKELFVFRQVHRFSLSGRLLKELKVLELTEQKGKVFPVHLFLDDTMKSKSSTEFITTKIEIGVDIPSNTFSLQELTW